MATRWSKPGMAAAMATGGSRARFTLRRPVAAGEVFLVGNDVHAAGPVPLCEPTESLFDRRSTKGLEYGDDKSLTLYLSHESLGAAKESNWLPAPAGPFFLRCPSLWTGEVGDRRDVEDAAARAAKELD